MATPTCRVAGKQQADRAVVITAPKTKQQADRAVVITALKAKFIIMSKPNQISFNIAVNLAHQRGGF